MTGYLAQRFITTICFSEKRLFYAADETAEYAMPLHGSNALILCSTEGCRTWLSGDLSQVGAKRLACGLSWLEIGQISNRLCFP